MCELLHTSNHRYFDGNNKGSLLSVPRVAAQTCASRPDPPAGPPIDGPGLATSAQEEKRGASWPTGQRHTWSPGSVRRIAISLWQPLASGTRLIGISKKAPLSAGLE